MPYNNSFLILKFYVNHYNCYWYFFLITGSSNTFFFSPSLVKPPTILIQQTQLLKHHNRPFEHLSQSIDRSGWLSTMCKRQAQKKSCCNTRASSSKPTIVWTHRQPITKRFLLQLQPQSKGPRKTPTTNFNHLQLQFQWILHQLMIMCRIKEGIFTPRLMGGSRAKIDLFSVE